MRVSVPVHFGGLPGVSVLVRLRVYADLSADQVGES